MHNLIGELMRVYDMPDITYAKAPKSHELSEQSSTLLPYHAQSFFSHATSHAPNLFIIQSLNIAL